MPTPIASTIVFIKAAIEWKAPASLAVESNRGHSYQRGRIRSMLQIILPRKHNKVLIQKHISKIQKNISWCKVIKRTSMSMRLLFVMME